ncbi:hypothetical protein ACFYXH_32435 [Streptomyces sp. NPDC002730]|uniref:hypothetical protein n=1 Tax=Streptomyces sp. NPDC002730 TaxID=3364662 RepID=UPI0036B62EB2
MTTAARAHAWRRTTNPLLAVFALLISLLATAGQARAAAVALPGGKANWVVSVGRMDLPTANNYRNWVRLGYYTFKTDGTVVTSYWNWNQRDQPMRVNTVTADCGQPVPTCAVKTVDGFQSEPKGGLQGTYAYTADERLAVTWSKDAAGGAVDAMTEYWKLETGVGPGGLARITSPTFYGAIPSNNVEIPAPDAFSTYSANFGVGYGSNASLGRESRASMTALLKDGRYNNRPYKGSFVVAKAGLVGREGAGGDWSFKSGSPKEESPDHNNPWRGCANGLCIGWNQHNTGCHSDTDPDKDRIRYIAEIGGGRRNTEWYWCQLLAQGKDCYQYNSHPRPMLQIVDDSGTFQGWVGVEAFTHVATATGQPSGDFAQGYFGIFDMVPTA